MVSNGIIPACAGSISAGHRVRQQTEDHPRMRGVHSISAWLKLLTLGSSPHARGPFLPSAVISPALRIIPACAGSIRRSYQQMSWYEDHPRMRGVHLFFFRRLRSNIGSSPHARGP